MTLEEVKKILEEGAFSPEAQATVSSILQAATARGHITEEEKTKLLELIDLTASAVEAEADAMDQMASDLEEFEKEAGAAVEAAEAELKAVDDQLTADLESGTEETAAV